MPKYDYSCPKCGQVEFERSMKDPEIKHCLHCGSKVKRIFGKLCYKFECEGHAGRRSKV